jgi:carbonic anhydrase
LENETGYTAVIPAHFYSFENLQENVVRQYRRLKSHRWIPDDFVIRGFIYDVQNGSLSEVALK